jgi:hypothetical protein
VALEPSIAADLQQLGIFTVEQLASSDGRDLYDRLCALTGVRQDPCVEDTFVCAVAQARDSEDCRLSSGTGGSGPGYARMAERNRGKPG